MHITKDLCSEKESSILIGASLKACLLAISAILSVVWSICSCLSTTHALIVSIHSSCRLVVGGSLWWPEYFLFWLLSFCSFAVEASSAIIILHVSLRHILRLFFLFLEPIGLSIFVPSCGCWRSLKIALHVILLLHGLPASTSRLHTLVLGFVSLDAVILLKDDEVVCLGTVLGQVEVLSEEAEELGWRPIISIFVRGEILILHHELKDSKADTLSLKRLVNVEIENAAWFNLLHGVARYVELLVTRLEECQGLVIHHHQEKVLVPLRVYELLMRRDRGSETLRLRWSLAYGVDNLSDLAANVSHIFATNQNDCCTVWKNFFDAAGHRIFAVKSEFHFLITYQL